MPEFDFTSLKKKETIQEESKEAISNAFSGAEVTQVEIVEKPKKPQPKITQNLPETEEFPITIAQDQESIINLPTKQEVDAYLQMYDYVKSRIVDDSDFVYIQNRKFLKKSGWRKFVKAFNISIQLIKKNIFELEGDVHAEVRVRASLPNGQFVEGYAIKSKSEYWSEKYQNFGNYNMHNLVATAYTRASNRAISDLVGFGEVSAEEVQTSGGDIEGAFGGKK